MSIRTHLQQLLTFIHALCRQRTWKQMCLSVLHNEFKGSCPLWRHFLLTVDHAKISSQSGVLIRYAIVYCIYRMYIYIWLYNTRKNLAFEQILLGASYQIRHRAYGWSVQRHEISVIYKYVSILKMFPAIVVRSHVSIQYTFLSTTKHLWNNSTEQGFQLLSTQ